MRILLLSTALLLPVLVPDAHAGDVEKAEHIRVGEEMRKLAQRNAWSAVEANYKALEELARKGEVLTYKEHMLGAEAARALGDITSCRVRLTRAIALDPKQEAVDWIADIDQSYGHAIIHFDAKWKGDRTLTPAVAPFAPDQRAQLATATATVAGGKDYDGLLPAGDYTVGGRPFKVEAGGDKVAKVDIVPTAEEKEPFRLAYVGPRANIGVAYTLAGSPNEGSDGLQAAAFSGGGARVGLGLEVGLSDSFGVLAEVGYHNLFGTPSYGGETTESTDAYVVQGNSLHMGYGWLAASIRAGNLWIAAGPLWGAGAGTVTGVEGACATTGSCPDFPNITDETARYQRLSGDVKAGGGAASVSYAMVDIGKLKGAVTLQGGAQTDSVRVYPWGQLAFTVAPASRRSE
ncbi:MAG: hypothetical protein ACOZNI_34280 [Myxococcota bacterium]